MTVPKISIIVPVYKSEQYLDRCINSIVNQTYKNIEIILVNDGSPDNSHLICSKWAMKDSRIKIINKDNGGVSSARNLALDLASGDYIGFVDSDDWIDPNMYTVMSSSLISSKADVVLCDYFYVSSNTQSVCEKIVSPGLYSAESKFDVIDNMFGGGGYFSSVWRGLFKRDIINNCNIRFKEMKFAEDLIFYVEYLLKCGGINLIDDNLYYYNNNQDSVLHKLDQIDIQNFINIPTFLGEIFRLNKVSNEETLRRLANEWIILTARLCEYTNNYTEFCEYLISLNYFYDEDFDTGTYLNFKNRIIFNLLRMKLDKIVYLYFKIKFSVRDVVCKSGIQSVIKLILNKR